MHSFKKYFFILFFISFFSLNNDVAFGQEAHSDYILETYHIEDIANEFPLIIEDEILSHHIFKVLIEDTSKELLLELAEDPRVLSFSPNRVIAAPIFEMSQVLLKQSSANTNWGFDSMNFPLSINSINPIDVAVMDTGIATKHPLFKNSIKNGYDALFNRSIEDDNGHGSHVAGIIAMDTPQVNIVPIKALDRNGRGDIYAFLRGVYYAIDQDVDVINMSFEIASDIPFVREAIQEASANGIIIVAASGNYGFPYLQYPARYGAVISVGAYNRNEFRANFSQYGNKLDFVAPGVDIWSAWMAGGYKLQSGTSMAAPFITKAIALMKSTNHNLSNAEIERILATASSPLYGETIRTTGKGKVDVAKALELVASNQISYEYRPSEFNVPSIKEWEIKMSLPIDHNKFEPKLVRVVDYTGNEVITNIQLDKLNRDIIKVAPPAQGYESGRKYELIMEKGLLAENGTISMKGAKMSFTIE